MTPTTQTTRIETIVFDAYGTLYDTHSVEAAVDAAFPGHGETITQIWRLKQLEYSWLRSMMGRYEDFRVVTHESLRYTTETLGLRADPGMLDALVEAYNTLSPYPEAAAALAALKPYRLAILSNGTAAMLDALVRHNGFDRLLDAVISVDAARAYKPDRRAYDLVRQRLGVAPANVLFVTSNGFDTAGARNFGFRVARVARLPPDALARELTSAPIGPPGMYKALRMRTELLGYEPDVTVDSLLSLPAAISGFGG